MYVSESTEGMWRSFEPDVAAEVTYSGADARGCGARLKPANRQSLGALAATPDTPDTACRLGCFLARRNDDGAGAPVNDAYDGRSAST